MESYAQDPMTLDANIIIGFLAGDEAIVELLSQWQEDGRPLFLSSIVEAEVLSFSNWTIAEREAAETFFEENFTLIPLDRTLARITAEIRRNSKTKFPDAAIAATALFTRTPLVTRNVKDFKHISGLQVVTV